MTPRKIIAFSIGPLLSGLLGLLTLPILAWVFSVEDIGRISMLHVVVSFSLLLFTLGLDQAYVREYHEVDDKAGLLKAVFLPGFFSLLLILLCASIAPVSISLLVFGIDSYFLSYIVISAVVLSFISRFLSLILRMQEKGLAYSISQIIPKLFFLLIILIYLLGDLVVFFEHLLIAHLFSLFIVFVTFMVNTFHTWLPSLFSSVNKIKQIEMLRYSIPLVGGGLAFWGLTAMDKIFLRHLANFEELGIYSVSFSFAGLGLILQSVFSTIWSPLVYKWTASGDCHKRILKVMDYLSFVVILLWCLVGVFSWIVTYTLPNEYNRVSIILIAVIAYPLLYTLSEVTGIGVGIKKKTIFILLASVVALFINTIGNLFLIPIYGASGAAISSCVAFFTFFLVKTEASSVVWVQQKRYKMYIMILMLIITSVFINIFMLHFLIIPLIYILILIFGLFLYKQQCVSAYFYFRAKYISWSLSLRS